MGEEMGEEQGLELVKTAIVMTLATRPGRPWTTQDLAFALNVKYEEITAACRELAAEGVLEESVELTPPLM